MKAVVWTRYGPPSVLQLRDVPRPVPKSTEILIRIHATTVTAGDCEMRDLKLPLAIALPMRILVGIGKPKRKTILGQEFAGEVEEVGRDVTRFRRGDRVFGMAGFRSGTYMEYICLPEEPKGIQGLAAAMPGNVPYEQAAAVPVGGLEALHFIGKANIQDGQKVLINGAGGSIGTFGVQLAKHFGAYVTAVDSISKLDMLRSIGADEVVDYKQEDFTKSGQSYDVIFDVVGKVPISRAVRALKDNGVYLLANPTLSKFIRGRWSARKGNRRILSGSASPNAVDLSFLKGLVESGRLRTVIDRCYPLEETAEAHRYVETGQKAGNVVITVREASE